MKAYEQLMGKLLNAVGSSQGKDPAAATGIIQQALRGAGLLGPAAAAAAPAADDQAPWVDLNPAPAWAREHPARAPSPAPAQGAGPVRDWMARFAPPAAPRRQADHGHAGRAPGQFLSGSFSAAAGTRRYRLYVPAGAAAGPRALVVMLHGCQQDADDFAAGTGMNALAEAAGCLVLYPEQARSANGSNCWNWFETPHQQRAQGEPSLIAGMTREIVHEHGADPRKVYVAGLSAGGAMAAILGNAYPELYAAIGVHSGLPAGSAHDLMSGLHAMKRDAGKAKRHAAPHRPVPAIVFHGDQDAVVHPSNGQAVLRQFAPRAALREVEERDLDGAGRGYTRTQTLDHDGRTVAEHWLVHGAGHAWAGGSAAGSYTDPAGPDASAAMLGFFLGLPPR